MRLLPGILAGQEGRFELVGDESLSRAAAGADRRAAAGRWARASRRPTATRRSWSRAGRSSRPLRAAGRERAGEVVRPARRALRAGRADRRRRAAADPRPHRADARGGGRAGRGAGRARRRSGRPSGCGRSALTIPGDISSAAPFLVAATLLAGLGAAPPRRRASTRRGPGFLAVLERMGARDLRLQPARRRRRAGRPTSRCRRPSSPRRRSRPDEVPSLVDELPLFALAPAWRTGESVVTRRAGAAREGVGPHRKRDKTRCGHLASASRRARGFRVRGVPTRPRVGAWSTPAATTGSRCSARSPGSSPARASSIEGAESVAVSFPGFFAMLDSSRVR